MTLELLRLAYPDADNFSVDIDSYYLTPMGSVWGNGLLDEWTESWQNPESEEDGLDSLDSPCQAVCL